MTEFYDYTMGFLFAFLVVFAILAFIGLVFLCLDHEHWEEGEKSRSEYP